MSAKPDVFFDLDGTLADSLGVLKTAYLLFLKRHGHRGTDAEFDSLNGPTTGEVAERLRRRYRLPYTAAQAREAYILHQRQVYLNLVRPMTGAERLLRRLRRAGYRLHLVTASVKPNASRWLAKCGWSDFFETATFGDEVKRGKPDPQIYERAFAKAGLRLHEERVIVEDSPNGCWAAKRAGGFVIRLDARAEGLPAADRTVRRLAEVESFLTREWRRATYVTAVSPRIGARLVRGVSRAPGKNRLFCLDRIGRKEGQIVVEGRFRDYWTFVRAARANRPHPAGLAVTGLVTVGAGEGRRFLVGRRSRHVATYPRMWEWVPAGGIDPAALKADGSIDLKKMAVLEFEEETGLSHRHLRRARVYGMIRDRKTNTYDFCLHLELKESAVRARLAFPAKEYEAMKWMTSRQVRRFERSAARIVPPFDAMRRCFALAAQEFPLNQKGK